MSIGLIAVGIAGSTGQAGFRAEARGNPRPNIVVVMTDDQNFRQLAQMSTVRSKLAGRGTSYRRFFVNFPLCCPSRATFLTGQYFHNHRVVGTYTRLDDSRTLPVWLRRGGYRTGFVGKYLNGYGQERRRYVPPGWSEWYAAIGSRSGVQNVYDYRLNENGALRHYGRDASDFKQDVITAIGRDFIERRAPRQRPFFLQLAYTAPHIAAGPRPLPPDDCAGSPQPAPRHAHVHDSAELKVVPSFNEANVKDKPRQVRRLTRLKASGIARITRRNRCMLESLESVDEGVGELVDALRAAGELGRTYVLFTSDNGFMLGEHRIRSGKKWVYEEAIRAPLVIRGPGISRGRSTHKLAVNPDLTRTVLDAANVRPRLRPDGVSLLGGSPTNRAISIESNEFEAVRTHRYLYAEHDGGAHELYDLREDPHELRNRARARSHRDVRRRMERVLRRVRTCTGRSCL